MQLHILSIAVRTESPTETISYQYEHLEGYIEAVPAAGYSAKDRSLSGEAPSCGGSPREGATNGSDWRRGARSAPPTPTRTRTRTSAV
jgi:hypothetical protein